MAKSKDGNSPLSRSALRRLREKEQRYNAILEAAKFLFAEQGYHQTSIEEIADAAEVSTGAVYIYFKNKEDLLIKLMQEIGHQLRQLLGDEFRKSGYSLDSFKNISFAFLKDFCGNHPEWLAIFFRESVGQSTEVEEQRRQVFTKVMQDIKAAFVQISKEQGIALVDDSKPELIGVCIVGVFERIAFHYFLWQDQPEDIDALAQKSISYMLGGIDRLLKE
ncbi:MAG: TetR/AcrR family transcriptional regulator [Dehalococcoidia bacterium]|nr:TetR/AcrR family transcriptional regulator [Dehalococcoidia bacterium]